MPTAAHQIGTEKLVSQLLIDDPELRDVVEEFVHGLPRRLAEMRAAYAQLDWELLRTLAHRLKGAGGSYGYPVLSQLAAEMERGFRSHCAGQFNTWASQLEQLSEAARAGLV
jgi:HPt (histidine-containing phosphotransfer) domain-containing protein